MALDMSMEDITGMAEDAMDLGDSSSSNQMMTDSIDDHSEVTWIEY